MSAPATTDTSSTVLRDGSLQRAGGIAAHVIAGTYVIGFLGMVAYLVPRGFSDAGTDPAASLSFLAEQKVAMYLWYLILFLIGGAALPVLVLALHERMRRAREATSRVAAAFGLIWSGLLLASGMTALIGQPAVLELAVTDRPTAVASWHAISTILDALGGGIELAGALWLLLICHASLRSRGLSVGLSALGIVIGVAGLGTLIPAVREGSATVFGVGLVVWFTWTAHSLLARSKNQSADDLEADSSK